MKTMLLAAVAASALAVQPVVSVLAQDGNANQAQQDQTQEQMQQNQAQQNQTQQNQTGQDQLPQQDREFAQKAAADNQAELELARLAQEQASNEEVKEYAGTLVEDHTKVGEELKQIAEKHGLTLDPQLPQEAQQAKEELSSKSGAAFDQAFVEQMVSDHEKAVQLYEDQAANGENEALKQFASNHVDTLRMHLDRARQLERQMGEQPVAGTAGGTQSATQQESMAGDDQQPTSEQQAQGSAAQQDNPLMGMTVGDIIGKTVVNQQGDEVGEIEDVVISKQDKVTQAVVSVGGFLGIGDKSVAISFDELQPGQDQESILLTTGATVDELKQRPAYDEASGDYDKVPEDQTPGASAM